MNVTIDKARRGDADLPLLLISALGILGVLYLLFVASSDHAYPGVRVATLDSRGSVSRRHARSLDWDDIGDGEPLYRRDIVYTPKGTTATLDFGNERRLELGPESMIQLEDVSGEGLQITLFAGKVKGNAVIKSPRKSRRALPPPRPHLQQTLPTLDGPDELEHELAELEARTKQWLGKRSPRLAMKKLGGLPPPPLSELDDYEIRLIEPSDQRYNLRANRWLSMRWSAVPGDASYELDVAKDDRFSDFLTYKTKSTALGVQFEDPGRYYWRVRASRAGRLIVSSPGHFEMTERGGVGLKRELARSAGRRTLGSLPVGYTAEVSRDDSFSSILVSRVVPTPRCPEEGLPRGSYYCRLTSVRGGGPPQVSRFRVSP